MPKSIRSPGRGKQRGHPYSKKPVKSTSGPQNTNGPVEQSSTFLSLPAEIRLRIYECLVDLQDEGGGNEEFTFHKQFERAYITLRPLLGVCRLVNQEWTPLSCYGAHLVVNCSQLSRRPAVLIKERVHFALTEYNNRFLRDPAQPKLSYIRKLTYNLSLPKSGSTDFTSLKRLASLLLKKPNMLRSLIEFNAYTQPHYHESRPLQWMRPETGEELWARIDPKGKWDAVVEVFSEILTHEWHPTKWAKAKDYCQAEEVGVTFSRPLYPYRVGSVSYKLIRSW